MANEKDAAGRDLSEKLNAIRSELIALMNSSDGSNQAKAGKSEELLLRFLITSAELTAGQIQRDSESLRNFDDFQLSAQAKITNISSSVEELSTTIRQEQNDLVGAVGKLKSQYRNLKRVQGLTLVLILASIFLNIILLNHINGNFKATTLMNYQQPCIERCQIEALR